jgi:hypothetical protein
VNFLDPDDDTSRVREAYGNDLSVVVTLTFSLRMSRRLGGEACSAWRLVWSGFDGEGTMTHCHRSTGVAAASGH